MAFEKLSDIVSKSRKSSGRGFRAAYNEDVIIATDCAGKRIDGSQLFSLRIAISNDVAKRARLIEGDRVEILFDKTEPVRCLVARVTKGGWAMTKQSGKSTVPKLTVKIGYARGMPTFKESHPCKADVTDQGILFELPKPHSFSVNLREEKERNE